MNGSVNDFGEAMKTKLLANEFKGGWDECALSWLLGRLEEEAGELRGAIVDGEDADAVLSEAADVANFAMMIAENYRRAAARKP